MVVAALIGIGLDPARAQLVTDLLMTAGVALISGLLVRQKSGAILGACLAFSLDYLIGFVMLQLQPQRDPGGRLEVVHVWVLVHTVLMLLALSFLSAFNGAAVGVACAEVVVTPLAQVAQNLQTRMTTGQRTASRQHRPVLWNWFAAGLLLFSLLLALDASNLFAFSPDVGIHTLSTSSNTDLPSQGTVVEDHMISPAMHGQQRSFLVYLPPSYNTPQGQRQHYPVLYLLHGSPGKDRDWFIAGKADQIEESLIAQKRIPELILVLPDGNGRGGETSEWGDSGDGQQRLETFIVHDLVSYIDQKYRTQATSAARGIGGNSMGGFGAMNIAVHHPDVFGFVIALEGYYNAEGSIWGTNKAYIQANSPAIVLPQKPQAWKLHLFIGATTNDQL
jgi:pimeloyl-ACP methyl ester carboxylesterase